MTDVVDQMVAHEIAAPRALGSTLRLFGDRKTSPQDVVSLAFLEAVRSRYPFAHTVRRDVSSAAADLVPPGATVIRCASSLTGVTLMAELDEALVLVETYARATHLRVAAATYARATALAAEILGEPLTAATDQVEVRMWHLSRAGSVVASSKRITAPSIDEVLANYPPQTAAALQDLARIEQPNTSAKLILWHGPPGTGKTTAVRALSRAWAPWCQSQYVIDPEHFFADAGYIAEVLSNPTVVDHAPTLTAAGAPEARWRLVIAEDTDEYLRATARREAGAAMGRLLNLADGILGQGLNVLILLTTNEDLHRLHPAITRPGRCLANIEFPAFDATSASAWLGRPVQRDLTLAELFERRGDLHRHGIAGASVEQTGQYL